MSLVKCQMSAMSFSSTQCRLAQLNDIVFEYLDHGLFELFWPAECPSGAGSLTLVVRKSLACFASGASGAPLLEDFFSTRYVFLA